MSFAKMPHHVLFGDIVDHLRITQERTKQQEYRALVAAEAARLYAPAGFDHVPLDRIPRLPPAGAEPKLCPGATPEEDRLFRQAVADLKLENETDAPVLEIYEDRYCHLIKLGFAGPFDSKRQDMVRDQATWKVGALNAIYKDGGHPDTYRLIRRDVRMTLLIIDAIFFEHAKYQPSNMPPVSVKSKL